MISNPLLLFPFFVLCFTLIISVATNGSASRFEVMTSLYALLFLVGLLEIQSVAIRKWGFAILSASVLINGLLNFSATELRSTGPDWRNQIQYAQKKCEQNPSGSIRIVFAPNWTASITHPYRIVEPTTEKVKCSILNRQNWLESLILPRLKWALNNLIE